MKKLILILIVLIVGIYVGVNFSMLQKQDGLEYDAEIQMSNDDMDKVDYENNKSEEKENLPDPEDIYADFSVKVNPDNSFLIETNLPDETELLLTLEGKGYSAQGKAIVKAGRAISPVFTKQGIALDGNYELEVLMPIPNVQSEYVKHFIGDYGEYLKGEYVKPYMDSNVVVKKFNVNLSASE